jgi:hypothetical protein
LHETAAFVIDIRYKVIKNKIGKKFLQFDLGFQSKFSATQVDSVNSWPKQQSSGNRKINKNPYFYTILIYKKRYNSSKKNLSTLIFIFMH